MTKDEVADALRALAKGDKNRSETARLRDVLDEVEAALAAGVSRAAVLEALHKQGFTMTLKSFESALYRLRKQRVSKQAKPAAAPPDKAPKNEGDSAAPEPEPSGAGGFVSSKQRRERLADMYVSDEPSNPLIKSKEKK